MADTIFWLVMLNGGRQDYSTNDYSALTAKLCNETLASNASIEVIVLIIVLLKLCKRKTTHFRSNTHAKISYRIFNSLE